MLIGDLWNDRFMKLSYFWIDVFVFSNKINRPVPLVLFTNCIRSKMLDKARKTAPKSQFVESAMTSHALWTFCIRAWLAYHFCRSPWRLCLSCAFVINKMCERIKEFWMLVRKKKLEISLVKGIIDLPNFMSRGDHQLNVSSSGDDKKWKSFFSKTYWNTSLTFCSTSENRLKKLQSKWLGKFVVCQTLEEHSSQQHQVKNQKVQL